MTHRRAPLRGAQASLSTERPLFALVLFSFTDRPQSDLGKPEGGGMRRRRRRPAKQKNWGQGKRGNSTQRTARACGGTEHLPPTVPFSPFRKKSSPLSRGRRSREGGGEKPATRRRGDDRERTREGEESSREGEREKRGKEMIRLRGEGETQSASFKTRKPQSVTHADLLFFSLSLFLTRLTEPQNILFTRPSLCSGLAVPIHEAREGTETNQPN